jgi:hypothetical protein
MTPSIRTPSGPASPPDVRAAAVAYHGAGMSVIPIRPADKRPLVQWKAFQGRCAMADEVTGWFRAWPDAGVGIVCGRISGIVVVDSDPRNGDGLAQIEHWLPTTPTAQTGGGGRALLFSGARRGVHRKNTEPAAGTRSPR